MQTAVASYRTCYQRNPYPLTDLRLPVLTLVLVLCRPPSPLVSLAAQCATVRTREQNMLDSQKKTDVDLSTCRSVLVGDGDISLGRDAII